MAARPGRRRLARGTAQDFLVGTLVGFIVSIALSQTSTLLASPASSPWLPPKLALDATASIPGATASIPGATAPIPGATAPQASEPFFKVIFFGGGGGGRGERLTTIDSSAT